MRRTVVALTSLLLLSACATRQESQAGLANSSWRLVSIDGTAPVSPKAKLAFEEDRIGANVGCNGMGGPWRLEGGRLIAGPLAQTEMFCEGSVWNQERALAALLAAAPELTVAADRLVLKSSGHSAELRRTR